MPKTTEQFRVEVGLEPGAPSVFLRNQQDCSWTDWGSPGDQGPKAAATTRLAGLSCREGVEADRAELGKRAVEAGVR